MSVVIYTDVILTVLNLELTTLVFFKLYLHIFQKLPISAIFPLFFQGNTFAIKIMVLPLFSFNSILPGEPSSPGRSQLSMMKVQLDHLGEKVDGIHSRMSHLLEDLGPVLSYVKSKSDGHTRGQTSGKKSKSRKPSATDC